MRAGSGYPFQPRLRRGVHSYPSRISNLPEEKASGEKKMWHTFKVRHIPQKKKAGLKSSPHQTKLHKLRLALYSSIIQ